MTKTGEKFEQLVEIMKKLRSADGCPWDREQSYKDIAAHTIEEAHEVADAISRENFKDLEEELGDLLLQVVFHSQMASEEKKFTIDEVIDGIHSKLIRRHPHVFGEKKVDGSKQVIEQWEKIKQDEGKISLLSGVPKSLPALLKAFRVGEKTSRVGFDWPNAEGILAKIEEESHELHEESKKGDKKGIREEYGDLLFTLANLGRFLKVDPEGALSEATLKFTKRFNWMESELKNKKIKMQDLSLDEWDIFWKQSKEAEEA